MDSFASNHGKIQKLPSVSIFNFLLQLNGGQCFNFFQSGVISVIYTSNIKQLFIAFILVSASAVSAKDLTSRLGLGMSNQFSMELPSLNMNYYPNPKVMLGGAIGVDTQEDNAKFGFMAKIHRVIFEENQMNFYMGAHAGLISQDVDSGTSVVNESGFELHAILGGEFFFTGLDSLGFSFETGIGVTSISSEVRFKTIADSPFRAGINFYF